MRVLLVTSDREQCGIREYGRMLMAELAKLGVEVVEYPHPEYRTREAYVRGPHLENAYYDVVHLNHHAALHASWKPEHVRGIQALGARVVVTQHDTFETSQIMQERGMESWITADAWITHEEVEGVPYGARGRKVIAWVHQGVPALPLDKPFNPPGDRPCLGLFGFDFPWKNFDMGVKLAMEAGWQALVISPGAAPERVEAWREMGLVGVVTDYLPTTEVVRYLAGCTATAFLYQNGNSGTSGAIRLGLAARRPVVALKCRQFRDLYSRPGVWWAEGEEDVLDFLEMTRDPAITQVQTRLVERAADEMSWARVAQRYKEIYEHVLKPAAE